MQSSPIHRIISRLPDHLAATIALCMSAAVLDLLMAVVDGDTFWLTASWGLGILWTLGVWSLVGGLFALVAVLVQAPLSDERGNPLGRVLSLAIGDGDRATTLLVLAGLLLLLRPVLEPVAILVADDTQLPTLVKGMATNMLGIAACLLTHRIVAWRKPQWAAPAPAVLAAAVVAAMLSLPTFVAVSPHDLWVPSFLVLVASAVSGAALTQRPRVMRVFRPMGVLGAIMAVVTVFTYDGRTATHAAMTYGTNLTYGALQTAWVMTDIDSDGASSIVGGRDCLPFDPDAHPLGADIPGDGVDGNCTGADARIATVNPPVHRPAAAPTARNLIILTVDALRADHVGLAVKDKPLTPGLDEFSRSAHTFVRTYSPSTHTENALPSMFYGQYASQWGLSTNFDHHVIAMLRQQGFRTVSIQSLPRMLGVMLHGFDEVDSEMGAREDPWGQIVAFEAAKRTVDVLRSHPRDKRLALWVHFTDPHALYVTEPSLQDWLGNDTLEDAYRQEVHRTDKAIAQVMLALQDLGYMKDSVVIVSADHGDAFEEHGMVTHVWSAHDEVSRVPLIIRLPDGSPGTHDQLVSLVDVAPTILSLMGVADTTQRTGRNLLPLMRGGSITDQPAFIDVIYESERLLWAVVDRNHKLIFDRMRSSTEVYDLVADPQETRNIVTEQPEVTKNLEQILGNFRDDVGARALAGFASGSDNP